MNDLQVRRATLEDLPRLTELWEMERLAGAGLERRLAEFQVVEADGEVAAVLGLCVLGQDAWLHSEAISRPELADEMRRLLWARFETLTLASGLARVWTCLDAPYWKLNGFRAPGPAALQQLPPSWAGVPGHLLYLPLKGPEDSSATIEKQLAVLKAIHQEENARIVRRARMLKITLTVIVAVIFGSLSLWALYVGRLKPILKRRR